MPTTAIGVMSSAHRYLQQAIQQKKEKNSRSSLQYPLRGSTALLAVGSRVLAYLHPPNLPEREEQSGFSLPQGLELRSSSADTK